MEGEQRIVIIGGGIAGVSAAQAARETAPTARIFLICDEAELPYYRTRILELINGADPEKLRLRSELWYIDMGIQVVRARATAVVAENRQVRFSDGSYLYYDGLVIATGASAILPETAYAQLPGIGPLRNLEDIRRVKSHPGPTVVVGDGLLALEAAWQLSRAGRDVTILGRGRRLLAQHLDKEGSAFLLRVVELLGIHVALQGELSALEEGWAYLEDGRAFEAASVVFAAGIRSNGKMGQSAGAALNRGILVDRQMRTSVEKVWAAGDCAELDGEVAGLWTVAMEQGAVAGTNAAGGDRVYTPRPHAYTTQAMGTVLLSYGALDRGDCLSVVNSQKPGFGKMFFEADHLVGVEMIGPDLPLLQTRKAVDAQLPRKEALALLKGALD